MQTEILLAVDSQKVEAFLALLHLLDCVNIKNISTPCESQLNLKAMKQKTTPQTFRDFSFQQVKDNFGLQSQERNLFEAVAPLPLSDWLRQSIDMASGKVLRNEKERSECLISPILIDLEFRNEFSFRVFSGESIEVDAERGLKGEFDFAFVNDKHATELVAPIFTLVEAKQGDITKHWGQIAAQMLAAQLENKNRNKGTDTIFGCITTGELWRFLKLESNCFTIDTQTYYLPQLEKIVAIFQSIVDFYKDNSSFK